MPAYGAEWRNADRASGELRLYLFETQVPITRLKSVGFELTGDTRFLDETRNAIDAAMDLRFNVNYQGNLTARGALLACGCGGSRIEHFANLAGQRFDREGLGQE